MALAAWDPRRALAAPSIYGLLMAALGADAALERFAVEVLRVRPGERVLDLGCGPGRLYVHIPQADYLGVDVDSTYLGSARRRHPSARFVEGDPAAQDWPIGEGRFDLVVAVGLLHHLDDGQAGRLLGHCARQLAPAGRLVTLDCALDPSQPPLARLLARMDRGGYVRICDGYVALARRAFDRVETQLSHDRLRIDYTHFVMTCRPN